MVRRRFSWKRATGISRMKSQLSRATGVPLTKRGRQLKMKRMLKSGSGCAVVVVLSLIVPLLVIVASMIAIVHCVHADMLLTSPHPRRTACQRNGAENRVENGTRGVTIRAWLSRS